MSLKCPFTNLRMTSPARFITSSGSDVSFDLNNFLVNVEKSRKWYCPHTLNDTYIKQLQVDIYLTRVLACLKKAPKIIEIEVFLNFKLLIILNYF